MSDSRVSGVTSECEGSAVSRAEEIMNCHVICVHCETTIYDAVRLMIDNRITGMPVVDDDNGLVGIISEKDVLRLVSDLHLLDLLHDLKGSEAKVEDFMTKEVVSFVPDSEMIEVCDCLRSNSFRRVPILDDGKVVGIISRKDIIVHIVEPIG